MQHIIHNFQIFLTDLKIIPFLRFNANYQRANIVSKNQQNRIRRSAELFLSYNSKYNNYDIRFDLVFIQPYKWPLIIKNAW